MGGILKAGSGSKPVQGNISDNKIFEIIGIPKSTLRDWKNSYGYKRDLYWILKSMSKKELLERQEESKIFSRW